MNYKIQNGDTLWNIVKQQFGLSNSTEIWSKVNEIASNNSIADPGSIFAGATINIDNSIAGRDTFVRSQDKNTTINNNLEGITASENSQNLANIANSMYGMNTTSGARCLGGVNTALKAAGLPTFQYPSAYMALNDLKNNPQFKEIRVSREELPNLPAGAIVVWQPTRDGTPMGIHGHISISDGQGNEISDYKRPQRTTENASSYNVFIPV